MTMNRDEVIAEFYASNVCSSWHWFGWHFTQLLRGRRCPFADAIVDALVECDSAIPGYASRTIDALAAPHGRDRHKPDYEQLMQRLAEVVVVRRAVSASWGGKATFVDEATAEGGSKNIELSVCVAERDTVGLEVKSPARLSHQSTRASNAWQLPSRALPREMGEHLAEDEAVTLPRDNPVKDFLLSADAKFAEFKAVRDDFIGLLVIVWDDFTFEPWTAMLHPQSGLLTQETFARNADGEPLLFPNVDGVIVTGHLSILQAAAGDMIGRSSSRTALDWGHPGRSWAGVEFAENPEGHGLPEFVPSAMEARQTTPESGGASDMVMWISTARNPPARGGSATDGDGDITE